MKIEIWSDVICPWCGLGEHRLDRALADLGGGDDFEVVHRSFQLDPSFPAGTTVPVRQLLRQKYRMSEVQLQASTARIEALAVADGLAPYRVGQNVMGNTRLAHKMLALASDRGLEDAAWKRLYRAYFGEGRSIFDLDALVVLGVEIGLIDVDIREAVATGRYRARVEADGREARARGATGVPYVVIDGRTVVAGAQPIEVVRATLAEAWRTRNGLPFTS